jgi:predicted enzyme related to lactoylglutathione lyase
VEATRVEAPVVEREEREGFARNTGEMPAAVPDGAINGTELYFHVDDVDDAVQRVVGAGASLLSSLAPRDWGDDAAYFADFDGNVIVVARPQQRTPAG